MTKDELARLKSLQASPPTSVAAYIAETASALPRLLEERERLLEALRGALEALRFSGAPQQLCVAAEAALTFATATAGKEEK